MNPICLLTFLLIVSQYCQRAYAESEPTVQPSSSPSNSPKPNEESGDPANGATAKSFSTESDEQLSKKILGAWDERKHITYFADGTWTLQRSEDLPAGAGQFSWSIKDGKLIAFNDGQKFVERILSLTATELRTQSDDGEKVLVFTRGAITPLPFPQRVANGMVAALDPKAVEDELNSVYNALGNRLGAAKREQLKQDQLAWLKTRELVKSNTDSHYMKGTVENLTYFTAARVSELRGDLKRLSNPARVAYTFGQPCSVTGRLNAANGTLFLALKDPITLTQSVPAATDLTHVTLRGVSAKGALYLATVVGKEVKIDGILSIDSTGSNNSITLTLLEKTASALENK